MFRLFLTNLHPTHISHQLFFKRVRVFLDGFCNDLFLKLTINGYMTNNPNKKL